MSTCSRRPKSRRKNGSPDFSAAVRSSEADIVVPVLHGWSCGELIGFNHRENDARPISAVFEDSTVTAPTLVLLVCHQQRNLKAWQRVAPSSRLVMSDDDVSSVATVVKKLVREQTSDDGTIWTGWRKWYVTEPGSR